VKQLTRDLEQLGYEFDDVLKDCIAHDDGVVVAKALAAHIAAAPPPDGAAVAAEYLEAKRVIDAGPLRPDSGFAPPRSWHHNDPEVIRWHKAGGCPDRLQRSGLCACVRTRPKRLRQR